MVSSQNKSQQQEKHTKILQLLRYKDEIPFLLDISSYMNTKAAMGSVVTRFESMLKPLKTLVQRLPKGKKISLLTIGGDCGQERSVKLPVEDGNRHLFLTTLKRPRPSGGTPHA